MLRGLDAAIAAIASMTPESGVRIFISCSADCSCIKALTVSAVFAIPDLQTSTFEQLLNSLLLAADLPVVQS